MAKASDPESASDKQKLAIWIEKGHRTLWQYVNSLKAYIYIEHYILTCLLLFLSRIISDNS